MSKLLINEPPLQVLPSLAIAIGLNEAIFLQQLHYWLTPTVKYQPHYREYEGVNRPWIYNTYHTKEDEKGTGWQANFPFWSVRTIKRIVGSLKEKGLIIATDQYNTASSNRTLWYTIDYDKLATYEEMSTSVTLDSDKLALSREGQVGTVMTETTTETTTDILPNSQKPENPNLLTPQQKTEIALVGHHPNVAPEYTDTQRQALNTLAPFIANIPNNPITTTDELKAITLFGYEVALFAQLDISTIGASELKALAAQTIKLHAKVNIAAKWSAFKKWWATSYWLGKQGQPPTIKQIGSTWGQFEGAKVGPPTNGAGPVLNNAEKARLAELVAENE